MRGFAAVFRRELAERRLILLAGIVGLVPLALPLLPGMAGIGAADVRSTASLVLALLASVGLAVLLGATAIGSELAQNRLGFYFARPLSGWAIWAGKLGAALALSLATALLVALPSLAIDGLRSWPLFAELPQPRLTFPNAVFTFTWFLLCWIALTLLAVLAAHAASVILRSRSALLALDLAALAVAAGVLLASSERLDRAAATGPGALVSAGSLLLAFAALAAGGAAQVVAGRTDARRGHRLLSLVLWAPLLTGALAIQVYTSWVLAATPADLAFMRLQPSPTGSWLMVQGEAAHRAGYSPYFLVDTRSERYLRLPPKPLLRFSADGRRAAWLEGDAAGPSLDVVTADLAAVRVRPVRSRFAPAMPPRDLALSPDGARVAAVVQGRLLVADLATGRLLAAVPLDYLRTLRGLAFTDPSHLRFYRDRWPGIEVGGPKHEILELDLATGRVEQTGSFAAPAYPGFVLAPDLQRLMFRRGEDDHGDAVVLDARTGRPLLDLHPGGLYASFCFLAGGGYAELSGEQEDRTRSLAIYGADGRETLRLGFAGAPRVRLGGQPDAGHLVYAERDDGGHWTSHLLDLATGAARLVGRDLRPLAVDGGKLPPPDLFLRHGALVRVDLATGAARAVVRAPVKMPAWPR